MFIVAALQNVKIADLTQIGRISAPVVVSDDMGDVLMADVNERLPDGVEGGPEQILDKAEERTLVRESTAGFAGEYIRVGIICSLIRSRLGCKLLQASICVV
jgi:proteasome activator subunit 4